jgi:hypothetical protein
MHAANCIIEVKIIQLTDIQSDYVIFRIRKNFMPLLETEAIVTLNFMVTSHNSFVNSPLAPDFFATSSQKLHDEFLSAYIFHPRRSHKISVHSDREGFIADETSQNNYLNFDFTSMASIYFLFLS